MIGPFANYPGIKEETSSSTSPTSGKFLGLASRMWLIIVFVILAVIGGGFMFMKHKGTKP
jgi:disulfide bond formation protein DsbB